jgi:plasmid stabilization system protein ParE
VTLPLLKRRRFFENYARIVLSLQEVNPQAAHRFCDSVDAALKLIAQHPKIARLAGFAHAPTVRIWPIRRYPNYVLLYRVTDTEIVLLCLLHGAQDLPRMISDE